MRTQLYDKITAYIIENQNRFYRLAYSYVKNQEDALDVVQNAICIALDKYEDLKNEDAVKTWFYRILVNESIGCLNRKKRELPTGEEEALDWAYHEKGYEPESDLQDRIDLLDEDVQKIVKLRFYEELSLKEIAEVMDMNLNTVKAKLYRGLDKLKQSMKEDDIWAN